MRSRTDEASETRFPAIYPPRPWGAIPPSTLSKYRGYLAQYKYNDIRALIQIAEDGAVSIVGRRRDRLKSYQLSRAARASLRSLRLSRGRIHVLDGGVMRTPSSRTGRRAIVLWDVLVHDGKHLLGTAYLERYELLKRICNRPDAMEKESGFELGLYIGPDLWLAQVFLSHLETLYEGTFRTDQLEGLILKDPSGRLERGLREENNGDWQVRARKSTGRHVF